MLSIWYVLLCLFLYFLGVWVGMIRERKNPKKVRVVVFLGTISHGVTTPKEILKSKKLKSKK